jgi:hypothetical protein
MHLDLPWAMRVRGREGRLDHLAGIVRSVAQVIGWAVLTVFATWVLFALALAIVHVMNYWASAGAP